MENKKQILRLTYASKALETDFSNILALVKTNKKNNEKKSIRSVLLFNHNYFLQVVEGPSDEVLGLFQKIKEDRRHEDVTLLSIRLNPESTLPKCGVLLAGAHRIHRELYKSFKDSDEFNPFKVAPSQAENFAILLANQIRTSLYSRRKKSAA